MDTLTNRVDVPFNVSGNQVNFQESQILSAPSCVGYRKIEEMINSVGGMV